ncbi:MAG TPA: hypothetical protein VNV15_08300 [Opitutaceae bacterium]|nr:hypothetical protein [Opitutaceae bacterium]
MPKWPFLAGDALLLGLALAIGFYSHNPFAGKPLILIVACVALGAVLGTWPFIADYESKRNEALDERQRGLEALAHTITSSAEQISIAAQSLPGIAETAAKNLKLAEQLPTRLQEKMGEIKQRLAEVSAAKKESSASEQAESERLATTADHIRQAVTELAKFEAAAQKNLSAAGDKLDAKAAQIFKQLDAKMAALSALAEKFSARPEPVERIESVEQAVAEKPASIEPIVIETPAEEPKAPRKRTPARKEPEAPPVEPARPEPARGEPVASVELVESVEQAVEEKPASVATTVIETPAEETKTPRKRAPKKSKGEDTEPSLDFDASAKSADTSPAPASSTAGDEFSQTSPEESASGEPARPELVERVESAPTTAVSADGATRLLVTAYIGIGNKLFLRGDGPGLSWDEGVPLQFVSIGKWRWETADATKPVHAKLYKNDELVCASLGKFTLDPGQQAEVTAAF